MNPSQSQNPFPLIDDLSQSLVQVEPEKEDKKKQPAIVVVRRPGESAEAEEDDGADSKGRKGKQLIYDEKMGQVVVKRKRKRNRRRDDWDEFDEDDF